MDREALGSLMPELDVFLVWYRSCFGREGNHIHARSILHGLLAGGDHRNVENMVEAIEGVVVRTLQSVLPKALGKIALCSPS